MQASAAKKIYEAKGRPSDNPLIVHIADVSALRNLTDEVPGKAVKLAKAFWPGPLTMIVKRVQQFHMRQPVEWTPWQCGCRTIR